MTPTNLQEQLIRDEGKRNFPYQDSVGKITIGVGRNLTDGGLTDNEVYYLLSNDMAKAVNQLRMRAPWTEHLDSVRRAALQNMVFNMGVGDDMRGLLGFHQSLCAIQAGNWPEAHDRLLSSHWAAQVGDRAKRLALQILSGNWQ